MSDTKKEILACLQAEMEVLVDGTVDKPDLAMEREKINLLFMVINKQIEVEEKL